VCRFGSAKKRACLWLWEVGGSVSNRDRQSVGRSALGQLERTAKSENEEMYIMYREGSTERYHGTWYEGMGG